MRIDPHNTKAVEAALERARDEAVDNRNTRPRFYPDLSLAELLEMLKTLKPEAKNEEKI